MPHFTCETLPINCAVHAARNGKVRKCRSVGRRKKRGSGRITTTRKTIENYILSFEGELIIA